MVKFKSKENKGLFTYMIISSIVAIISICIIQEIPVTIVICVILIIIYSFIRFDRILIDDKSLKISSRYFFGLYNKTHDYELERIKDISFSSFYQSDIMNYTKYGPYGTNSSIVEYILGFKYYCSNILIQVSIDNHLDKIRYRISDFDKDEIANALNSLGVDVRVNKLKIDYKVK